MTTQEEAEYIQQVLPLMAKKPTGFYLSEDDTVITTPVAQRSDFFSIAKRLVNEGLATPNSTPLYLAITTKGKQIAEQSGGYLGSLHQVGKRQRTEERRAKLNVAGTFGSMVVAALALLFSLYTYFSTASNVKELEKKVQAYDTHVRELENILRSH